uniref:Uncharacterized protein n=1 Tax=Tetraselmis sp. GSL018 TaxID=582737 RepID=A0A061SCC0_9CHLO|mmetsp:Transcript_20532/g.48886  ORF Transcript_20532/g.48886 Transcript_20532/m.48886 type:complete len:252 (-) Transcript_20532:278-1033(-)|eukprot:CAMPEP_0177595398 /NCGR_PEP_ID=MMETSP0419_2-20121207/10332_1 /TAXON_ID=582737 /ORGANISM="Tetraselmis sp., Strain GSL018" /LENGTH=251 /DNA_ID=CAMNT_0019086849 /DNA_START=105 /DNA_END=860 /DNA_ORIENTATION=-
MADAEYHRPACSVWKDDVITLTNHGVNTTGGHKVWTAARHTRDVLERNSQFLGLCKPGAALLELGAGCGWLGLTLARNLPDCTVLLTEQSASGAVEHLWKNISANSNLVGNRVSAEAFDWTYFAEGRAKCSDSSEPKQKMHSSLFHTEQKIASSNWEFVIGSDLVYNQTGVEILPEVLSHFAKRGSTVLYGHSLNRFDFMDVAFVQNLRDKGLKVKKLSFTGEQDVQMDEQAGSDYDLFPELLPTVFIVSG